MWLPSQLLDAQLQLHYTGKYIDAIKAKGEFLNLKVQYFNLQQPHACCCMFLYSLLLAL